MKSDGDSSSNCSSPLRKCTKINADASPSTTISSLGSPGELFAVPKGSPGDRNRPPNYINNVRKPQKLDFGQGLGVDLNNNLGIASSSKYNPGTARSFDDLSIEELLKMEQQIQESIKRKSIQTQTNLQDTLQCESQDNKYSESQDDKSSESQDSDVYEGVDFFKRAVELNKNLDEEISQEEEYSQKLDDEIIELTNQTINTDNMSVEKLEELGEENLKNMFNTLLQKKEYEELRNIYKVQQKKAKEEATTDKTKLKDSEKEYNEECSQVDFGDSQMTSSSCISSASMMETTIKEIYNNKAMRQIEHKNRQDTVRTIIDARYKNEINFDNIRDAVEDGKSTNEQMSRIWGNYIEGETFKDEHCCYLCGGKLVNKDKEFVNLTFNKSLKPEIEHKLPAIEFYGKVHNIINRKEYEILFGKWQIFINNTNPNELLEVYNSINCNETEAVKMNSALDKLCNIFKQENNKEENIDKFICLIKINLIEFAYSHHTCNQVKSNNNLRKSANQYTESIKNYLSNLRNVINKDNMKDQQQIIGLIRSYKLQHEKQNILVSIANANNTERIESNMRLINSLIDDYTRMCNKTPIRMIAESIRDMKNKITNKKNEKEIKKEKNKIQQQLSLNRTQIDDIIRKFDSFIKLIDEPQNSRKSPRTTGSASDPIIKFKNLYTDKNIEEKNGLIKEINKIIPRPYNNFDRYVNYYNNNLKSNFPGIPFARPKSVNGGKKSRRLRLKSNRKTKKRGRKSKK